MLLPNAPDDKLYRVQVHSDTNTIEVSCIGIDKVDAEAEGMYCSADALPIWLQESVDGVGRRIDKTTYWVIKPNEC